jgi:hypothetical protein
MACRSSLADIIGRLFADISAPHQPYRLNAPALGLFRAFGQAVASVPGLRPLPPAQIALESICFASGNRRKPPMSGKMAFVALAITAVGILGAASAAASDRSDRGRDPCVVPCSLDGVNPVYHPRIFGNPAFAKAYYGFVQGRDHAWHVIPNCIKPAFIGPCGTQ